MAKKKTTTRKAGKAVAVKKKKTSKKTAPAPAPQKKAAAPLKPVVQKAEKPQPTPKRAPAPTRLLDLREKPVPRPASMPPLVKTVSASDGTATETLEEMREELTPAQLRRVKTGLTKKDLDHYRELLLQKRAEILGDVEAMEEDARSDSGDHLSPEHMADVGSNNYEQEFTLGLVASERRLLGEIDEALGRIADRTYGVCLERGVPIARPRLDAKPWAKYCIEVALEKERRGQM